MKYLCLFTAVLSASACIQSSLIYTREAAPKPLITLNQALNEAGLLPSQENPALNRPSTPDYPAAVISERSAQPLSVRSYTIETAASSTFILQANTQNRYLASVFYVAAGFIYLADESNGAQGKFVFQAGNQAGEIRIRTYNKDGRLQAEEKWFIEVR